MAFVICPAPKPAQSQNLKRKLSPRPSPQKRTVLFTRPFKARNSSRMTSTQTPTNAKPETQTFTPTFTSETQRFTYFCIHRTTTVRADVPPPESQLPCAERMDNVN